MPKCRFCDHNVPLGTYLCPNCGAPVDTATAQTEDLEQQVRSLLGQGQKLEAVKLYKNQTDVTLLEAKNAVESIQRATSPPEPASDMEVELLRLLEAGKKLEAVKIYKQRTGVQLIEAKQAVEALARRHGIAAQNGGCFGVLLAVLLAAVVVSMMIQ